MIVVGGGREECEGVERVFGSWTGCGREWVESMGMWWNRAAGREVWEKGRGTYGIWECVEWGGDVGLWGMG